MKNNFRKNGNMRVRYETAEERREILRILEEQRGFRIDEEKKQLWEIHPLSTRVLDFNLKFKTIEYGIPPFIGAAMMASGIRFYSAQEFFRIAENNFRTVPRYPVFHVPHNGQAFPEELMESVIIPEKQFRMYHEEMRDMDIIRTVPEAYRGGDMCEYFQISRLLCDPERFTGPEEIMEQYGMGFCYEKAYDGTTIKHITPDLKQKTLEYYRTHHERMDEICSRHPRILLLDMHSYSDKIIPQSFLKQHQPTPDICIGTDERYTPNQLTQIVQTAFENAGYTTKLNYPYTGCYIPNAILKGESTTDCIAVMLEIHKRTYCDEDGNSIPEKLKKLEMTVRQIICGCVEL